METCLEQPSYMEQACRHFKPLENLGLKPSATQITVSTMDTCCFVIKTIKMFDGQLDRCSVTNRLTRDEGPPHGAELRRAAGAASHGPGSFGERS